MVARITHLFHYPVKSCARLSVNSVVIDALGIAGDRRWMVVRADDGRFLSQREYPGMAVIRPELTLDDLILTAPDISDLAVSRHEHDLALRNATVWGFSGIAEDEGDLAAAWVTAALGVSCRLVRAGATWDRPVNPEFARPADRVGFADGYPVLLSSAASLRDLNRKLSNPVPMERFRPNIVIDGDGLTAWAEDNWSRLQVVGSPLSFRVAKPCDRCGVITVDQPTGERQGPEPLQTLASFRRDASGKVLFAVNLIPDGGGAAPGLRVGDCLSAE